MEVVQRCICLHYTSHRGGCCSSAAFAAVVVDVANVVVAAEPQPTVVAVSVFGQLRVGRSRQGASHGTNHCDHCGGGWVVGKRFWGWTQGVEGLAEVVGTHIDWPGVASTCIDVVVAAAVAVDVADVVVGSFYQCSIDQQSSAWPFSLRVHWPPVQVVSCYCRMWTLK